MMSTEGGNREDMKVGRSYDDDDDDGDDDDGDDDDDDEE